MAELSQEQLEEMVVGKQPDPRATFYEKARLNHAESKRQGRRVYDRAVYIQLVQPGVKDYISYPAKQEDIENYPHEYKYFLKNRQGTRHAGIEVIPGLDIIQMQELHDAGLHSVEELAQAEHVPAHLQHIQRAAVIIHKAMEESRRGKEESIKEEGAEEGVKASVLPTPDRQQDAVDVGRSDLPGSAGIQRPGSEGRHEADRPLHRSPSFDNWTVTAQTKAFIN